MKLDGEKKLSYDATITASSTVCVSNENDFYETKRGSICSKLLTINDLKSLPMADWDSKGIKYILLFSNNTINLH